MYDDEELLLEKLGEYKHQDIYMFVSNEGKLILSVAFTAYELEINRIIEIERGYYLRVYACKDSDSTFLYKLPDEKIDDVKAFFSNWNIDELKRVKDKTWSDFLNYWQQLIKFVNTIVDIEVVKPTYKIYATDNTDYGGGIHLHADIHFGDDAFGPITENEYYENCNIISERWIDVMWENEQEIFDVGMTHTILVNFRR